MTSDKSLFTKSSSPKSSPQIKLLEEAFFNDPSIIVFLIDCRILSSFIKNPDENFFKKLCDHFDKNYVEKYVDRFRDEHTKMVDNPAFKNRMVNAFRDAFLSSFRMTIENPDFRFPLLEFLVADKLNMMLASQVFRSLKHDASELAKYIDKSYSQRQSDSKSNKISLSLLDRLEIDSEVLLHELFLKFKTRGELRKDVNIRIFLIVMLLAVDIFLWNEAYISGKNIIIANIILAAFVLFHEYGSALFPSSVDAASTRVAGYLERGYFGVIDLGKVKRSVSICKGLQGEGHRFESLEIFYKNPIEVIKLSSPIPEPSQPPLSRDERMKRHEAAVSVTSAPAATYFSPEPATRPPEVKTLVINLSEQLGYPARYNSQNPQDSTIFPVIAKGFPNLFASIDTDPDLTKELEMDKAAAKKFIQVVQNAALLRPTSLGKQGIKPIPDQFITLADETFAQCYKLKPIGKQKDKRLLGYLERVEKEGVAYHVIRFKVFVLDGHNNTQMQAGVRELQQKLRPQSDSTPGRRLG